MISFYSGSDLHRHPRSLTLWYPLCSVSDLHWHRLQRFFNLCYPFIQFLTYIGIGFNFPLTLWYPLCSVSYLHRHWLKHSLTLWYPFIQFLTYICIGFNVSLTLCYPLCSVSDIGIGFSVSLTLWYPLCSVSDLHRHRLQRCVRGFPPVPPGGLRENILLHGALRQTLSHS